MAGAAGDAADRLGRRRASARRCDAAHRVPGAEPHRDCCSRSASAIASSRAPASACIRATRCGASRRSAARRTPTSRGCAALRADAPRRQRRREPARGRRRGARVRAARHRHASAAARRQSAAATRCSARSSAASARRRRSAPMPTRRSRAPMRVGAALPRERVLYLIWSDPWMTRRARHVHRARRSRAWAGTRCRSTARRAIPSSPTTRARGATPRASCCRPSRTRSAPRDAVALSARHGQARAPRRRRVDVVVRRTRGAGAARACAVATFARAGLTAQCAGRAAEFPLSDRLSKRVYHVDPTQYPITVDQRQWRLRKRLVHLPRPA